MQGGGGGWVLKKQAKMMNRGRGSSLSVQSLCEKNCLIFKQQTEFFLISCVAVASFEPSPVYKGVLLLKRRGHFFSSNVFYEHVNICIVIVYVTV